MADHEQNETDVETQAAVEWRPQDLGTLWLEKGASTATIADAPDTDEVPEQVFHRQLNRYARDPPSAHRWRDPAIPTPIGNPRVDTCNFLTTRELIGMRQISREKSWSPEGGWIPP